MLDMAIRPDVVSCTAFASALAAGAQWQRCEEVLQWMQKVGAPAESTESASCKIAFQSQVVVCCRGCTGYPLCLAVPVLLYPG